jgi:hypothetical protein
VKGLVDRFLEYSELEKKGIQPSAMMFYKYDREIFDMGMINDTFMKKYLRLNYYPSLNSVKEIYAELVKEHFHAERIPDDRKHISESDDMEYVFFDKLHC